MGRLKMRDMKMRDMKMRHKKAEVENVRYRKCEKLRICEAEIESTETQRR